MQFPDSDIINKQHKSKLPFFCLCYEVYQTDSLTTADHTQQSAGEETLGKAQGCVLLILKGLFGCFERVKT